MCYGRVCVFWEAFFSAIPFCRAISEEALYHSFSVNQCVMMMQTFYPEISID